MNTNPNNQQSQSTAEWMASNRLYEEYLFFYVIILSVITAIGYYTFGFEIDGWTQAQNLAINFLLYAVLLVLLFLTPTWYNLIYDLIWGRQARLDKEEGGLGRLINSYEDATLRRDIQQLCEEDPTFHQELRQIFEDRGEMPLNRKQVIALIVLFCFFNFELFFINAWVKGEDYHLVWQPDWVNAIIDWMRSHLNTPPLHIDRDIFYFDLSDSKFTRFESEDNLLSTRFADSGLFFHFWRFISCPVYLIIYIILLWRPMNWLGMSRVDPKNIQSVGRFLIVAFVSIFMLLFLLAHEMISRNVLYLSFPMVLGKEMWLHSQGANIYYVLTIIALKFLIGWFHFWKNVFIKMIEMIKGFLN